MVTVCAGGGAADLLLVHVARCCYHPTLLLLALPIYASDKSGLELPGERSPQLRLQLHASWLVECRLLHHKGRPATHCRETPTQSRQSTLIHEAAAAKVVRFAGEPQVCMVRSLFYPSHNSPFPSRRRRTPGRCTHLHWFLGCKRFAVQVSNGSGRDTKYTPPAALPFPSGCGERGHWSHERVIACGVAPPTLKLSPHSGLILASTARSYDKFPRWFVTSLKRNC